MRAIVVTERGGADVLRLQERPRPTPGPGDLIVKVEAAGVNYADVMQHYGTYPLRIELPYVPGMEVVGTVVDEGSGVSPPRSGERVAAISFSGGGYAEFIRIKAHEAFRVPPGVDSGVILALLIQGLTAYAALHRSARLKADEQVLVHAAAGGVGHLAVQMARRLGAGAVAGLVGADHKRHQALADGAGEVFNHRTEDWAGTLLKSGWKADIILDSVGESSREANLSLLKEEGRLITYGWLSGRCISLSSTESQSLLMSSQSIVGFALDGLLRNHPNYGQRAIAELMSWVKEGELCPRVGQRFDLTAAPAAHAALIGTRTEGKIVIDVDPSPVPSARPSRSAASGRKP